jgi:hypothetical protein
MGARDAAVFFTDNAMAGIFFLDAAPQHQLDLPIGDGYGSIVGFEKDVRRSSKIPQRRATGCISKAVRKSYGMLA